MIIILFGVWNLIIGDLNLSNFERMRNGEGDGVC